MQHLHEWMTEAIDMHRLIGWTEIVWACIAVAGMCLVALTVKLARSMRRRRRPCSWTWYTPPDIEASMRMNREIENAATLDPAITEALRTIIEQQADRVIEAWRTAVTHARNNGVVEGLQLGSELDALRNELNDIGGELVHMNNVLAEVRNEVENLTDKLAPEHRKALGLP